MVILQERMVAVNRCFTDNDYGYKIFYQSVDTVI